jgi:hypothetical protein
MVPYHQCDHPQEKQQHHHDNTQRQQQIQAAFQPIVRVLLNGHMLVRLETDNIVRPFLSDTPPDWSAKGPYSSMGKLPKQPNHDFLAIRRKQSIFTVYQGITDELATTLPEHFQVSRIAAVVAHKAKQSSWLGEISSDGPDHRAEYGANRGKRDNKCPRISHCLRSQSHQFLE